jgi:hypothetical protein
MATDKKSALHLVVSTFPRHAHPAKASAHLPIQAILRHIDNLQILALRDPRFAKAILRSTEYSARRSAAAGGVVERRSS